MACKRGGSLFLQSISSSLIRNRNHNTRALSICNRKRTSHPNTASINKMEEAHGIPIEQAKATSIKEVPNENAQVLRIGSIVKKLEHEIRQARDRIEKESTEERTEADKAFSDFRKEIDQLWPRTNIAYYCACTGFLVIAAKGWL